MIFDPLDHPLFDGEDDTDQATKRDALNATISQMKWLHTNELNTPLTDTNWDELKKQFKIQELKCN